MNIRAAVERYLDVRSEQGDELNVLCPVHDDKNPSCRVNVKKKVWYCHTCHACGSLEKLLQELAGGVIALVDEFDVASLHRVDEEEAAPRYYPERWLDQFDNDDPYWYSRLLGDTIRWFRFGFDVANEQPVYPLRDSLGRVLGVVRRQLGRFAKPRYIYPVGVKVHHHLFGYAEHLHGLYRHAGDQPVVLTEGAVDAAAMSEAGARALGIYGSRLHPEQVTLLRRLGVVSVLLAFDDDEAGDSATQSARELLDGFLVETVDWSLLRGPERPAARSRQLDPASVSLRKRRELLNAPLPLTLAST